MSSGNDNEFSASLQEIMAAQRKADFKPLGRAEFEARFVEPNRKPYSHFAGFRAWAMAGTAFALMVAGILIVPKLWHTASPIDFTASGELRSLKVEKFGEIFARNAHLVVAHESTTLIRASLIAGECLIRFDKNVTAQRVLRIGDSEFIITGTIVFASASSKSLAVLEGQVRDANGKLINAGTERSLTNAAETPLSQPTMDAALALADVSAFIPKRVSVVRREESMEEKIFRKYGNVHSVVLKSSTTILAAKVRDTESGQEKLFTLKGPLYISEAEIREVRRIR